MYHTIVSFEVKIFLLSLPFENATGGTTQSKNRNWESLRTGKINLLIRADMNGNLDAMSSQLFGRYNH